MFRTNSTSNEDKDNKQKLITDVYKDVKPRVDSRWKKTEIPALKVTKAATATMMPAALSKHLPLLSKLITIFNDVYHFFVALLLSEQTSKPKLAEIITMQKLKLTKPAQLITLKKEPCVSAAQEPLIKSPGSFKLRREKVVENVQMNYYESHSSKLIHQIEDIDVNDGDNPQLLSEYVNDIYAYLFKLENIFPIRENFLAQQVDVTPKMRSVLLDWINEVHNQFSLELETYHMTVSMIDRFLQNNQSTPRRYLQLVGVTCLFMASKYEELMPPEISDFVYVTGKSFFFREYLEESFFTQIKL